MADILRKVAERNNYVDSLLNQITGPPSVSDDSYKELIMISRGCSKLTFADVLKNEESPTTILYSLMAAQSSHANQVWRHYLNSVFQDRDKYYGKLCQLNVPLGCGRYETQLSKLFKWKGRKEAVAELHGEHGVTDNLKTMTYELTASAMKHARTAKHGHLEKFAEQLVLKKDKFINYVESKSSEAAVVSAIVDDKDIDFVSELVVGYFNGCYMRLDTTINEILSTSNGSRIDIDATCLETVEAILDFEQQNTNPANVSELDKSLSIHGFYVPKLRDVVRHELFDKSKMKSLISRKDMPEGGYSKQAVDNMSSEDIKVALGLGDDPRKLGLEARMQEARMREARVREERKLEAKLKNKKIVDEKEIEDRRAAIESKVKSKKPVDKGEIDVYRAMLDAENGDLHKLMHEAVAERKKFVDRATTEVYHAVLNASRVGKTPLENVFSNRSNRNADLLASYTQKTPKEEVDQSLAPCLPPLQTFTIDDVVRREMVLVLVKNCSEYIATPMSTLTDFYGTGDILVGRTLPAKESPMPDWLVSLVDVLNMFVAAPIIEHKGQSFFNGSSQQRAERYTPTSRYISSKYTLTHPLSAGYHNSLYILSPEYKGNDAPCGECNLFYDITGDASTKAFVNNFAETEFAKVLTSVYTPADPNVKYVAENCRIVDNRHAVIYVSGKNVKIQAKNATVVPEGDVTVLEAKVVKGDFSVEKTTKIGLAEISGKTVATGSYKTLVGDKINLEGGSVETLVAKGDVTIAPKANVMRVKIEGMSRVVGANYRGEILVNYENSCVNRHDLPHAKIFDTASKQLVYI